VSTAAYLGARSTVWVPLAMKIFDQELCVALGSRGSGNNGTRQNERGKREESVLIPGWFMQNSVGRIAYPPCM